ncbi:MAG: 4-(cytidine 5'-diphospho)-2-C-methyl-D-erythritol kinase [Clostridiales Family XIII bacterium]|jgi:4-diphosphocytidyl-2-C-methyl-D-erythritol kinase|nr:4-(cytidine 5'-diphospho)-2-C-methyl-D-erythritol kinase [Clostridiales Family XIII bacterium]
MFDAVGVDAYAKINISLDVICKRDDGYHEVRTVMQQVGLFDTVDVSLNRSGEVVLELKGEDGCLEGVPAGEDNLAVRAALLFIDITDRLREEFKDEFPDELWLGLDGEDNATLGAHISIHKRIPSGAGLGGASADAAAVLLGLSACVGTKDPEWLEYLMTEAIELGSDVPFCMMGQARLNPSLGLADAPRAAVCALGEGRGEELRAAPPFPGWALLLKPSASASTARVYDRLDVMEIAERPDTDALLTCLAEHDPVGAATYMGNVLEAPAFAEYPEIAVAKRVLQGLDGVLRAQMSGSGSTVFALFKDEGACQEAAETVGALINEKPEALAGWQFVKVPLLT